MMYTYVLAAAALLCGGVNADPGVPYAQEMIDNNKVVVAGRDCIKCTNSVKALSEAGVTHKFFDYLDSSKDGADEEAAGIRLDTWRGFVILAKEQSKQISDVESKNGLYKAPLIFICGKFNPELVVVEPHSHGHLNALTCIGFLYL